MVDERDNAHRQLKELAASNQELLNRVKELAEANEQLNRQLVEIPQNEGVPVKQLKAAIAHHRSRSGCDTARGKMLHELADDVEAVLAGETFEAKEKHGGRKPKNEKN